MSSHGLVQDDDAAKRHKILNDPDFVCAPAYSNSLARIKQTHPEGVPDKDIAKYLDMPEGEINQIYAEACVKIRQYLQ